MKNTKVKAITNYNTLNLSAKQLEILNCLSKIQNGANFKIQYAKDCSSKVSAKFKGNSVTKITTSSVRKGIDYENLYSTIEKRNMGIDKSNRPLCYSHIDKVLCKHNTKEQYYVMLFPNPNGKPHSQFFLNGNPISKEELYASEIMQPSFWKTSETKPDTMLLSLDNIVKVF